MKLDITSLYFNGDTESAGNTASWGTILLVKTFLYHNIPINDFNRPYKAQNMF